VDAILTSGETVRRDRPALTIRVPEFLEGRTQPWRVVVTERPETMPGDAALFSDEWKERTLIRGRGDMEGMLRDLVKGQGVNSVLLEAGVKFSAAMIAAGLVDEAVLYFAPILCGGTVPALAGVDFPGSLKLRNVTHQRFGDDLRIRGMIVGKDDE
jgi:diaminohydroxyphosphoribosylaminopyrimidine deaminase/5-amino-6-(5-phosphoribosylamino)uracil reductase